MSGKQRSMIELSMPDYNYSLRYDFMLNYPLFAENKDLQSIVQLIVCTRKEIAHEYWYLGSGVLGKLSEPSWFNWATMS